MFNETRPLIMKRIMICICIASVMVFLFADSVFSSSGNTVNPERNTGLMPQAPPGTYTVFDAMGDPVTVYQDQGDQGSATDVVFREVSVDSGTGNAAEISKKKKTYHQTGYATWYNTLGSRGASGTRMNSNSAAHRTISFHTIVTVKSVTNHRSTKVEILDRGPWGKGRIIDMSRQAFSKIYPTSKGVFKATITWKH